MVMSQIPSIQGQARASTFAERQVNALKLWPRAGETAYQALTRGQTDDYRLARLSDATLPFCVAAIAGLGSIGLKKGASLPLWVGGFTWLAAMTVTRKINNAVGWLFTHIDQDTTYISSNGHLRNLFEDPNFMPLQVIPMEERLKMANRLGLSPDNPNRSELLQAKIRQVAVQMRTWWMLMAGFATPLLSALMSDALSTPVRFVYHKVKSAFADNQLHQALQHKNRIAAGKAITAKIEAQIGSGSDTTPLSRWWTQLSKKTINSLALTKALHQDVLLHPNPDVRYAAVLKALEAQLKNHDHQTELKTVLDQAKLQLTRLFDPLTAQVNELTTKNQIDAITGAKLRQKLLLERLSAEAMVDIKLKWLLQAPQSALKGDALQAEFKNLFRGGLDATWQAVYTQNYAHAVKLAGGEAPLQDLILQAKKEQFGIAFKQAGMNFYDLFENGLTSAGLRSQWFNRFGKRLGLGMLAATAVFYATCLGRQWVSKPDRPNPLESKV